MSSTKSKAEKPSGKETRHDIEKKLDLLLADLKKELGDTKFKSRIKKAAKLLTKGVEKAKKKAAITKKKAAKPAKTAKAKKAAAAPVSEAAE